MDGYWVRAEKLETRIIGWYQRLHENPELGFQEQETAAWIENVLKEMDGVEVSRPCPTGVMGVLKGNCPGRTVAFRADMDALPLEELVQVPYRSKKPGVMHACGHDGHVAMLLGAARMLSERREGMPGEIRFLFQPAEEVMPGGAVQMIRGGVLEGVDQIFGAHLDVLHPVNSFGIHTGPLMAASSAFRITIEGNGGHGAFPFQAVDTVYIAARIIEAVQGIMTRKISAMDRAVATITQMQGSGAANIIPATVVLGGTLRVLDVECQETLQRHLEEIVKGCCRTWGAEGILEFGQSLDALVNPPELRPQVEASIRKCPGTVIYEDTPVLGGEDFSAYLKQVPGFYYKVGARPEDGRVYPHHNPHFQINPRALARGAAVCAQILEDAIYRNQEEERYDT